MEHRGKNSKINEDEVKAEIGSNKSWNREYEKVKPTCGNCGKSVTRQRIRVHEMLCYRRSGVASEKTVDRFGYFKVCGKCGKTFTHSRIKGHEDTCQGETPRATCKEDHEHETVEEEFDSVEAAATFFYDNMFDAEFSVRESHKRGQSG